VLSEYNGLKYAEISEVLGIPVGTVKSRIFSAVPRLKVALKDHRQ
jgi:DNA-directed RNA polymerase specialized sigma24 family protein